MKARGKDITFPAFIGHEFSYNLYLWKMVDFREGLDPKNWPPFRKIKNLNVGLLAIDHCIFRFINCYMNCTENYDWLYIFRGEY